MGTALIEWGTASLVAMQQPRLVVARCVNEVELRSWKGKCN